MGPINIPGAVTWSLVACAIVGAVAIVAAAGAVIGVLTVLAAAAIMFGPAMLDMSQSWWRGLVR